MIKTMYCIGQTKNVKVSLRTTLLSANAIHCMGQNIKSLAACFCVCVCVCVCVGVRAHGYCGPNISKTVRDRGSVTMGH